MQTEGHLSLNYIQMEKSSSSTDAVAYMNAMVIRWIQTIKELLGVLLLSMD